MLDSLTGLLSAFIYHFERVAHGKAFKSADDLEIVLSFKINHYSDIGDKFIVASETPPILLRYGYSSYLWTTGSTYKSILICHFSLVLMDIGYFLNPLTTTFCESCPNCLSY